MTYKNLDPNWTDQTITYFISNSQRVAGDNLSTARIDMGCILPQYPYFLCKVINFLPNIYGQFGTYRFTHLLCDDFMEDGYSDFTHSSVVATSRSNLNWSGAMFTETTSYFVVKNFNNTRKLWRVVNVASETEATYGFMRIWSLQLQLTPLAYDRSYIGRPISTINPYSSFMYTISGTSQDQLITLPKIDLPYQYYFIDVMTCVIDCRHVGTDAVNGTNSLYILAHNWIESIDNNISQDVAVLSLCLHTAVATTLYPNNMGSDNLVGIIRADTNRLIRFRIGSHNGNPKAFSTIGDPGTFAVTGEVPWSISLRCFPIA